MTDSALPLDADLREPRYRREVFQRFYSFHLRYRTHPGLVYLWLPALADALGLDADQRAWLVWLNGNTQNPVTSLLLLEAAPTPDRWEGAVALWREHYAALEWDTDRRYQKARFGDATEAWYEAYGPALADGWAQHAGSWTEVWDYANGQPYMGRLSTWSMIEYARILLPGIPDADTLLLDDLAGSRSHRNSLGFLAGHDDAIYWPANAADAALRRDLAHLGADLLREAVDRNPDEPDVGYLTMESALCTYKSWHKPNRRYPNVYADLAYGRLRRAERHFGRRFDVLWEARERHLPAYLRLESTPTDPGLVPVKQNHYLTTGRPIMMSREYPDLTNTFDEAVASGAFGIRPDMEALVVR